MVDFQPYQLLLTRSTCSARSEFRRFGKLFPAVELSPKEIRYRIDAMTDCPDPVLVPYEHFEDLEALEFSPNNDRLRVVVEGFQLRENSHELVGRLRRWRGGIIAWVEDKGDDLRAQLLARELGSAIPRVQTLSASPLRPKAFLPQVILLPRGDRDGFDWTPSLIRIWYEIENTEELKVWSTFASHAESSLPARTARALVQLSRGRGLGENLSLMPLILLVSLFRPRDGFFLVRAFWWKILFPFYGRFQLWWGRYVDTWLVGWFFWKILYQILYIGLLLEVARPIRKIYWFLAYQYQTRWRRLWK